MAELKDYLNEVDMKDLLEAVEATYYRGEGEVEIVFHDGRVVDIRDVRCRRRWQTKGLHPPHNERRGEDNG
jgi:hypothetical protein